ncbi:endoglucanase [Tianweitania sp. BSSL-BM11]|uniref:cellulase n=1 Tax=Tianweitania aestuarii TaxID=2814886 RepID=A0ABS5RVS0_9HYPH|nr:glycosyl hydrolase family 8 [Tianweitania aestuarii]MBS9720392.1 endoglucanase [Tianweitania aestuarii]
MNLRLLTASALAMMIGLAMPAQAQPQTTAAAAGSVSGEDWAAYKAKFLDSSGRIIDTANGGISHSEGQGYGLILAYLANSAADFDQIWTFTKTELLLRDDGLAVWRWDPTKTPHVTDANDASDGDILIAYALSLAGEAWQRPDLTSAAQSMIAAIGKHVVVPTDNGGITLLPGVTGFKSTEREDGPVVNPSYWVFEAMTRFASRDKAVDWKALSRSGQALVQTARFGERQLPAEWVSIKQNPVPAEGFTAEFGYNAIRIPLYMIRAGITDRNLLRPFMADAGGPGLSLVNLNSGAVTATLTDPGYRIIPSLVACVLDKKPLPQDLLQFTPTDYYPATLQLLALSYLRNIPGGCT